MIYLVRHGLDDERFIGGYSNVSLTEVGKKQIRDSALWFKSMGIMVSKIYSSDIKRALQSAIIISDIIGLDIYKDENLRELNKGKLNGINKDLAQIIYPDYCNVDDVSIRYPLGESMIDFYKRIKEWFITIDKYDDSLLVTHRGVINMLYYLLLNEDLDMDKEKFGVVHASIHELDIDKLKIRRIR